MLNKELLLGNTGEQQPVALKVGKFSRREFYYYGYDSAYFGTLTPVPFWGNNVELAVLAYFEDDYLTKCVATDRSYAFKVYISGHQSSPISAGESISGDPFNLSEKADQTVYLTFDPPPMVTWIQKHSNQSKKRLLRRSRRSLGGAKC